MLLLVNIEICWQNKDQPRNSILKNVSRLQQVRPEHLCALPAGLEHYAQKLMMLCASIFQNWVSCWVLLINLPTTLMTCIIYYKVKPLLSPLRRQKTSLGVSRQTWFDKRRRCLSCLVQGETVLFKKQQHRSIKKSIYVRFTRE